MNGDFQQLTETISTLKSKLPESCSQTLFDQRKNIYEKTLHQTRTRPRIIQVAEALAAFLREKQIIVCQEDLLAGHHQRYDYTLPDRIPPQPSSPDEADTLEQFAKGQGMGLFGSGMGGHVIAGYHRVIEKGLGKLAQDAQTALERNPQSEHPFAAASLIVCRAATDYALRYAARAGDMANTTAHTHYANRLGRIGEACRWVALNPPRTFFEALQLLWLTHEIITCEQRSGSLSLGRIDQYLLPYYTRDIAAGTLTRSQAAELIQALWIKLAGTRQAFQNVALGGSRPDGTYAANDLSYICLQATMQLRMDQPLLSVRWHPSMPPGFWDQVQQLIQLGMGFPALFNDQIAIDAKRRMGITPEDAHNYGIVGCVELSIPGKEFSHTEGLRVNWAKILELMLNNGRCTVTGQTIRLRNKRKLETITSFEDFCQWYHDELAHATDLGIRGMNIQDRDFPNHSPYPFLSSTMQGCLQKNRDVTDQGTIYNLSSVNGCGMADTADSLIAIKNVVFRQKKATLAQLAHALRTNFDSAPELRTLLRKCPKCGNDLNEPDTLLRDLANTFCQEVQSHRNPRGGRFQSGLYTVGAHATFGTITGALPSGRPRGIALANGMSPCQGADTSGPTTVIRSTTRLDHRLLGNGMVLDLKFNPTFFTQQENRLAFKQLIETYFHLGGMEIQFNVIAPQTLLAAQETPQQYRDLIVRVSGFSAYFIDLERACQDEIIARTDYTRI